MKKETVISFFDKCAPWWDDDMIRNEDIIATILDNTGIRPGIRVLDVACGTGVLFPDYLSRGVAEVIAIDISPEMAKIAAAKFPQVHVICGDVEEAEFPHPFDAVMVYNAFPHFPDPAKLVRRLAELVVPGGRLSIAHGMSRAALIRHHERASAVSIDLLHENELAALLEPWFEVDVIISNDRMYQVCGVRREGAVHTHNGIAHSHACSHGHDHGGEFTPMEELLALMKYMVGHNDAHAQEMASLAQQLKDMGKTRAYDKIMDAVADFDMLNAKFAAVLQDLEAEDL